VDYTVTLLLFDCNLTLLGYNRVLENVSGIPESPGISVNKRVGTLDQCASNMSRVLVKGGVNKVFLKPWVMDPLQYHGYGASTSGDAPFYLAPFAGTHCAYPLRAGQAEWTWVASYIGRLFTCSHMVTHFSTNRARRRAVILIKASAYCILLLLLFFYTLVLHSQGMKH